LGDFGHSVCAVALSQSTTFLYFQCATGPLKPRSLSLFLSPSAQLDLSWWVANIEKANGKIFFPCNPNFEIFSDASLTR
jgi:hypothetical protein